MPHSHKGRKKRPTNQHSHRGKPNLILNTLTIVKSILQLLPSTVTAITVLAKLPEMREIVKILIDIFSNRRG